MDPLDLYTTVNFDQAPSATEHQTSNPDPPRNGASIQPPTLYSTLSTPLVEVPTSPTQTSTPSDYLLPTSSSPTVAEIAASIPGLLNALRKVMPNARYEGNLAKLQERCTDQGGDPAAIARMADIFAEGISREALQRPRPKGGARLSMTDGFLKLVGHKSVPNGDEGLITLYWCLLCPFGERLAYKDVKNLCPHLCSKHFGLPSRGKE